MRTRYHRNIRSIIFAIIIFLGYSSVFTFYNGFTSMTYTVVLISFFIYFIGNNEDLIIYPLLFTLGQSLMTIPWNKDEFRLGPIPLAYIPFVIYAVVLLICIIKENKFKFYFNFIETRFVKVFAALFTAYIFISIMWVIDYNSWFVYFAQWFIYIWIVFWGTVIYTNTYTLNEISVLLSKIYNIIFIMLIIGIFRYVFKGYPDSNFLLILNRNGTLFIVIPLLPFVISKLIDRNVTITDMFVIVTYFLWILLLYSRTGYIAIFITTTLLIGKYFLLNKALRFRIIIVVLVIISALGPLYYINQLFGINLFDDVVVRMNQLITSFIEFLDSNSISYDFRRQYLIEGTTSIIRQRPLFGTGLGLNNFLHYFPSGLLETPARAHNLYLSYFAELGLFGLVILMSFLISIVFYFINKTKTEVDSKYYFTAFLSVLIVLVAFGTNEYITFPYIWFIWGLMIKTEKRRKNK